jgi:histidyl-tRNA synthetase
MNKPSLPQGMRDFSSDVVRKRKYILNCIRDVFELYGFEPLETPAMENLETLLGKYGEEGDRLIFKVLNNGLNDPKNIEKSTAAFQQVLQGKSSKDLSERALKYDLTIPFARFVAMNHSELTMPYKRYQMQPVWRADRPQKGRYREFTQCDADVVGSRSLMNEVELLELYQKSFNQLGIQGFKILLNNRKILTSIAEKCGGLHQLNIIAIAIDKLDKIGKEKVMEELVAKGLDTDQCALVDRYLEISGTNEQRMESLRLLLGDLEMARLGLDEISFVLQYADSNNVTVDPTLARGLDYYTGMIFEVKAPESVKMGSLGGGGRYDDLTGLFGLPGIPGVGISFGIDRIYDVMEEMALFPKNLSSGVKALFFNLGKEEAHLAKSCADSLRNNGISCELFHEQAKMDKQFKYAERKHIAYAVIIGSRELESNTAVVKELATGNQESVELNQLVGFFSGK